MQWYTILLLTLLTIVTTSQAHSNPYSNDTFVIPNLVTTTYTSNRRRGTRVNHMFFSLLDNSYNPQPRNTTCNAKWRTTEPAPSKPVMCKDPFMAFTIQIFTDIKDFKLNVGHIYGADCSSCCNSADQFKPYGATASANITRDGVRWRRTRTTSGGTVSAVADEAVIMQTEYMNMCDGYESDDDAKDDADEDSGSDGSDAQQLPRWLRG